VSTGLWCYVLQHASFLLERDDAPLAWLISTLATWAKSLCGQQAVSRGEVGMAYRQVDAGLLKGPWAGGT
jgi:hypothetical protein